MALILKDFHGSRLVVHAKGRRSEPPTDVGQNSTEVQGSDIPENPVTSSQLPPSSPEEASKESPQQTQAVNAEATSNSDASKDRLKTDPRNLPKLILPSIYVSELSSVPSGGITIRAMVDVAIDFELIESLELLALFLFALSAQLWVAQTYVLGTWRVGKREAKQQVFQKTASHRFFVSMINAFFLQPLYIRVAFQLDF